VSGSVGALATAKRVAAPVMLNASVSNVSGPVPVFLIVTCWVWPPVVFVGSLKKTFFLSISALAPGAIGRESVIFCPPCSTT
jgi:hypothetical protein